MMAEAVSGRALRGSWMANPEVYRIYDILKKIHTSHAVVAAPLVLGKETLLDASLGPAVARIASDQARRNAARAQLPVLARRLLDDVETHGEVRMDQWPAPTRRGRAARLLLERLLLVHSRDLHTQGGYHTAVVMPWSTSTIAIRCKDMARRLTIEEAQEQLILASVRAAVIVPEREARRWFTLGALQVDTLIARGTLDRTMAGKVAWLTVSQQPPDSPAASR